MLAPKEKRPPQVKHRNVSVYNRLKTMIQTVGRRFHVFSNEHHTDTYIKVCPLSHTTRSTSLRAAAWHGGGSRPSRAQAMEGESPNDRNDRAIRTAARWYQSQLEGTR